MEQSKGLGDTIDKITTKTGVKKLNELFPYNKNK